MWKSWGAVCGSLLILNSCEYLKLSDAKLKEALDEVEDAEEVVLANIKGVWENQCYDLGDGEWDKTSLAFSSSGVVMAIGTYSDEDCEDLVKMDHAFLSIQDLELNPGVPVRLDGRLYEFYTTFLDPDDVEAVNTELGSEVFRLGRPTKVNGIAGFPAVGEAGMYTIMSINSSGHLMFGEDMYFGLIEDFEESMRPTELDTGYYYVKKETADVDGMVGLIEADCITTPWNEDANVVIIQDGVRTFYSDALYDSQDGSCTGPIDSMSRVDNYSWTPQGDGLFHVNLTSIGIAVTGFSQESVDTYLQYCGVTVAIGETFVASGVCPAEVIPAAGQTTYTSVYSQGSNYQFAGGDDDHDGSSPETRVVELIDIGLEWKRQ